MGVKPGKRRAADGFPEPFPLRYVEIGNEDWFDNSGSYDGRFTQIAKAIRQPKSARAVGLANNQNPIAIIVPCHRVIGANGSLTGYGGGMHRKKWLLQHETRFAKLAGQSADLFTAATSGRGGRR